MTTIKLQDIIYEHEKQEILQPPLFSEAIRSINKEEPFSMLEFKALKDYKDIITYTSGRLQEIGRGSSRIAYILSQRFVLKVARNKMGTGSIEAGTAQNEAEYQTWDYATNVAKFALPKSIDINADGYWLISELCRPLNNYKDFRELAGVTFTDMEDFIERFGFAGEKNFEPYIAKYDQKPKKIFKAVYELLNTTDLVPIEFKQLSAWGKTIDGRLVLLDSGGTSEVLEQYYWKLTSDSHNSTNNSLDNDGSSDDDTVTTSKI